MTEESPPSEETEQAKLSVPQRFLGFLRSLAVLFAAIGGIAVVGGVLIVLWVGDLRSFGLGVLGAGAALLLVVTPGWAYV